MQTKGKRSLVSLVFFRYPIILYTCFCPDEIDLRQTFHVSIAQWYRRYRYGKIARVRVIRSTRSAMNARMRIISCSAYTALCVRRISTPTKRCSTPTIPNNTFKVSSLRYKKTYFFGLRILLQNFVPFFFLQNLTVYFSFVLCGKNEISSTTKRISCVF